MPNQQTFSDDFNRANSADIGSVWDNGYTTYSGNAQIVSNRVRSSVLTVECLESVNAPSFSGDQWAQITLASFTGTGEQNAQLALRIGAPPTVNCYIFAAKRGTSETSSIKRMNLGSPTTLVTENATTWGAGDIMRVEAAGTSQRLYRNNVLLLSASDGSFAVGRPALWLYTENNLANVEIDDFLAGNIVLDRRMVLARQAVHRASYF